MAVIQADRPKKLCFVTIGATASFDALIKSTLEPEFLKTLRASGYTDLLLQHGTEGRLLLNEYYEVIANDQDKNYGLNINGFDFNKQGLGEEMRAAKGESDDTEGAVISHAGMASGNRAPTQDFI